MGLQDTESESSSEDKKFDEAAPVIESSDRNKSDNVGQNDDVLSNSDDLVATVSQNDGTIGSSPSEETKSDLKTMATEEIEESCLVEQLVKQMAEVKVSDQICYFELQQTAVRTVSSVKTSRDGDSDDEEPEETNDDDADSDDDVQLPERGKIPNKPENHRFSPFRPPSTSPRGSPSHQSDYLAQSCTSYQVSHSRALTGGQMEIRPVPIIDTPDRRLSSSPRNVLQNGGSIIYHEEVRSSTPASTSQMRPNANIQFPSLNLVVEGYSFPVSNAIIPSRPDNASTSGCNQLVSASLQIPIAYTELREVGEASPMSMYSQGSPSSDESISPPDSVQSASSSDSTNDLLTHLDIQSRRNSSEVDSSESNGSDFARENSFSSSGEGDSSLSSDDESSYDYLVDNFPIAHELPNLGDLESDFEQLANENNNNSNAQHHFIQNENSISIPFNGTANESTSLASFVNGNSNLPQNDNRPQGRQMLRKVKEILNRFPRLLPKPGQPTSGTQSTGSVSPIANNIQITPMSAVQRLEAALNQKRLQEAQKFAQTRTINFFLSCDFQGDTQLHCVMNDNFELIYAVVEKFFENNIDVDIDNALRQTPLFCAVVRNIPLIVDYLIERGANPAHRCTDGTTPMHVVAKHGDSHLGVAQVLCRHLRSTPQHLNQLKDGCTPLVFAVKNCRTNCVGVVTTLLQCGAQIEIPDGRDGKTALHLAVENGSLELVNAICESCPNIAVAVNLGTFTKDTALHMAAKLTTACDENVQLNIIGTLLRYGAKVACNKSNRYPRDLVYDDRQRVKETLSSLSRTRRVV